MESMDTTTGWENELKLLYDGDTDTWTADDAAFRLVVTVHHDHDASINDYEGDGKVSQFAYNYNHDARTPRPDGFTGAAMKIQVDRGLWMWWQPYDEEIGYQDTDGNWLSAKWGNLPREERHKQIARIRTLLEGGFVGVDLAKQIQCSMGHWHDTESASLWGIDSLDNGYGAEVVNQLIGELE